MMYSTRYLIILIVTFLISCSQDNQPNGCSGHSTIFLHSTVNTDLKESISKKFSNENVEVVSDVLELISIIEELSDTLIIESGGIDSNTNTLLNGCRNGNYALEVFDKINVNERLKNKVTALKEEYSTSKKDEEIIQMIDYLLSNYFYGSNPLFNKEYIIGTSFSNLSLDLLLIQNALYILLINKY